LPRAADDAPADVVVESGLPEAGLRWRQVREPIPVWRAKTTEGSFLRVRYDGADGSVAEFVVDGGGTRVWFSLSEGVLWEEAAELLLGPVFSAVMSHRGHTCLHAAVLQVHARVVALAGAKGSGKSTTSLELVRRGAAVVSDDVAVLAAVDGRVRVAVGPPRLRVRREVADALGVSYDSLVPMWVHEEARPEKRYAEVPVASPGSDGLVPLDAIYILGARDGDAVSARRLSAVEALPRLMTLRHLGDFVAPDAQARDFTTLADVATRVPVFDLVRPDGLETLDQVVATVLDDVRSPA
jgi:hypothetical protein